MKIPAVLLLVVFASAACEKKPAEPLPLTLAQEAAVAARAAATPKPTPAPGSWMWENKGRTSLDQKPKR